MTNPSPRVPAHKSEIWFRRMEPHILKIMLSYPDRTIINPEPYSVETVRSRLRDAVASLFEYKWTSPIDLDRLRVIWPEIQTDIDDLGRVVVTLRRKGTKRQLIALKSEGDFFCRLDNPAPIIVHALAILIVNKIIDQPVILTNVPELLIAQVKERNPSLSVTPDEDNSIILI